MNIRNFRHRGLRRFWERDDPRGLPSEHVKKLRVVLTTMHAAEDLSEVGLFPGWRLHPLRGDREGQWAITITRNWRIVFEIENDEIVNVDFEDYH